MDDNIFEYLKPLRAGEELKWVVADPILWPYLDSDQRDHVLKWHPWVAVENIEVWKTLDTREREWFVTERSSYFFPTIRVKLDPLVLETLTKKEALTILENQKLLKYSDPEEVGRVLEKITTILIS